MDFRKFFRLTTLQKIIFGSKVESMFLLKPGKALEKKCLVSSFSFSNLGKINYLFINRINVNKNLLK